MIKGKFKAVGQGFATKKPNPKILFSKSYAIKNSFIFGPFCLKLVIYGLMIKKRSRNKSGKENMIIINKDSFGQYSPM